MSGKSSSWGQWLGINEEKAGRTAEEKAAKQAEKEAQAVQALRSKLSSTEEGKLCAQQLADGGEFGRDGKPSDLLRDEVLRRWLVAREWRVDVTYKLLLDHGAWRTRYSPGGAVDEARLAEQLADGKAFLQGVDDQGRALVVVRVANHVAGRDVRQLRLFAAYALDAAVALCDPVRNPQRRVVAMFDFGGSSYANMDASAMKGVLAVLAAHYVERLAALYFFDPPRIFHALWNASKHLVHEVTRNKIKMIDPSHLGELRACVPADVLPKEYGGDAPLRPIDAAVREFGLPRLGERGSSGSGSGGGSASDGAVDAALLVEDDEQGAGGKAAAAAAALPAVTAVAAAAQ